MTGAAVIAAALAAPAFAQNNDAPVDVTAAPPPTPETIGPSQLRDFNLQGTVTRPADSNADAPGQTNTAPAAPRSGQAVPAEAAEAGPVRAAPNNATASRPSGPAGVPGLTVDAGQLGGAAPVTPSQPLEVTTNPAPQPGFGSDSLTPPAPSSADALLSWPWLLALLALVGGGAFIAWSRRGRRRRATDPGRLAFAGLVPDAPAETQPSPPVSPRGPSATAPRHDPIPPPQQRPSAAPKPVDSGLIVSTRLKPELTVEFQPDRVVVSEQEVLLQFDIVLANVGSAPARDVLVEGRLFTAHVGQDQEIAAFFRNPAEKGDRMTAIAPLGRISLKSVARLPLDQVHRFEAGGRKLFVPMIAFNIIYRSGGGEGQASASFLVGRGNEQDEKLAPFRLDLGPRIFRGLASRPHSIGMQPA